MSEFDRVAYCEATADDTATAICASFDYTDAAVGEVSSGLDVFYLLFAGAMVFFMQSGFAMLCAGSIRQKASSGDVIPAHLPACQRELTIYFPTQNVKNIMLKVSSQDASRRHNLNLDFID